MNLENFGRPRIFGEYKLVFVTKFSNINDIIIAQYLQSLIGYIHRYNGKQSCISCNITLYILRNYYTLWQEPVIY